VFILGAFSQYFFGTVLFIVSLFLILLVLVQRGRGGGLTGALGGPGGQSAFGTKAGDVFTKITIGTAALWIILCAAGVYTMKAPDLDVGDGPSVSIGGSGNAATTESDPLDLNGSMGDSSSLIDPDAGPALGNVNPSTADPSTADPSTADPSTADPAAADITPAEGTDAATPSGEVTDDSELLGSGSDSSEPDTSEPATNDATTPEGTSGEQPVETAGTNGDGSSGE
jgi:preprotein translocase subunit SecG